MRIVTWNVLHGLDLRTGRVDLPVLAEAIAGLAPDVVGLQEVDRGLPRSAGEDQVGRLAELLGWHGCFAPSLIGSPETTWERAGLQDPGGPGYGLGLLSRHRINDTRRIPLPGGGDGGRARRPTPGRPGWDHEPRIALAAELDVDGRSVQAVNVHLSYMPWRAVRQLLSLVRRHRPRGTAVLMGDFNLPPRMVQPAALGWTHAGGAPTHPATEPKLQLDQVLVRGGRPVAAQPGPAAGSDHRSLVVEAAFPQSRRQR